MIVSVAFVKQVRGLGPNKHQTLTSMRSDDGYVFADEGRDLVITHPGDTMRRRRVPWTNVAECEEQIESKAKAVKERAA